MLIQTTHTDGRRGKERKNKSIILESLKEATLNKRKI